MISVRATSPNHRRGSAITLPAQRRHIAVADAVLRPERPILRDLVIEGIHALLDQRNSVGGQGCSDRRTRRSIDR